MSSYHHNCHHHHHHHHHRHNHHHHHQVKIKMFHEVSLNAPLYLRLKGQKSKMRKMAKSFLAASLLQMPTGTG